MVRAIYKLDVVHVTQAIMEMGAKLTVMPQLHVPIMDIAFLMVAAFAILISMVIIVIFSVTRLSIALEEVSTQTKKIINKINTK